MGAYPAPLRKPPGPLSSLIAGFKAGVTNRVWRELNIANIWQPNFYGYNIRSDTGLKNFWCFIDSHPLRWQEDWIFSPASPNRFNPDGS